jgi:hypothetical protein
MVLQPFPDGAYIIPEHDVRLPPTSVDSMVRKNVDWRLIIFEASGMFCESSGCFRKISEQKENELPILAGPAVNFTARRP